MTNFNRKWTDERISDLKSLYEDGKHYSEIALEFGVSRSAVAGVIRKYIRKGHKPKTIPVKTESETKTETEKSRANIWIKPPKFKPLPFSPRTYQPECVVPLEKAAANTCRQIVDDPRSLLCCGEPIHRGSYCAHHASINYL